MPGEQTDGAGSALHRHRGTSAASPAIARFHIITPSTNSAR